MKRVLVDVNVLFAVLLDRAPHAEASARVWAAAETGEVEGGLAGYDAIVTRDPKGFPRSPVRVISPEVAATLLAR